MNKLSSEKRTQVITALVEGCSINSTSRMTGVAKNTILKLLAQVGIACADFQDRVLTGLKCKRIQCDEIWQFCYAKEKNVPAEKKGQFGYGDVWTWVAIDADTKLVPSFMLGNRDLRTARIFIDDLASRLASRVQLTSDGLRVYLDAVEGAFGCEIDYASWSRPMSLRSRNPLQSRYLHFLRAQASDGTPRPDAHLYELRGAPEPQYADEYAAIHPLDQRPLEEDRKYGLCRRSLLHVLQLRPHP